MIGVNTHDMLLVVRLYVDMHLHTVQNECLNISGYTVKAGDQYKSYKNLRFYIQKSLPLSGQSALIL